MARAPQRFSTACAEQKGQKKDDKKVEVKVDFDGISQVGTIQRSNLAISGSEDLGGGLKAGFWLEAALNPDDGGINSSGKFWHRRSTVSLAGNWGEIRLGRDYTPQFWNLTVFDPFGTNGAGTTLTLLGAATAGMANVGTRGVLVRASNSIGYFLPGNLGGFYGQVNYWFGENDATGNEDLGDGYGLRLGYHITEDFFVQANFAQTKVSDEAFRQLLPGGGMMLAGPAHSGSDLALDEMGPFKAEKARIVSAFEEQEKQDQPIPPETLVAETPGWGQQVLHHVRSIQRRDGD